MKKVLLVIIVLLCVNIPHSWGISYYFSSAGNDVNVGTNFNAPFKSILKLNTLSLKPGDNVFFKRGETFSGQINVVNSGTSAANITFGAYGIGANPILSGTVKINNWKVYSGNIYVADVPESNGTVNQIFVNGSLMTLARYPNSGYMTIDSSSGNTNLFSSELTQASGHWTNANLVVKSERWVYENRTVTDFKGKTLLLTTPTLYAFKKGFGFFLNNKLIELDAPGEWYYDASTKKLYLMTATQQSPNNCDVQASVYDYGFSIVSQSYINITGVSCYYQGLDGINTMNCNNIAIKNSSFSNNYRNGISTSYPGGTKISIISNSFSNIGNNGINANGSTFCNIQWNTLKRIALNPGLGESGDGNYIGIAVGSDSYIAYNVLDSIGYSGIYCHSRDTVVYNQVKNTCLLKDDGGSIYCYKSDHLIIKNNIIINSVGNGDATSQKNLTRAQGIYLDDSSSYCTLSQNTVVNADYGLFIHNSFNNTITGNVLYNNRKAQLTLQNDNMVAEAVNIKGNTITGNTFYSLNPNQLCIYIWTYKNNVANYGSFDKNYYCNPYSKLIIKTVTTPYYPTGTLQKNQMYTIEDWKKLFVQDIYSKTTKANFGSYYNVKEISANLITNYNLQNKNGWYKWGSSNYSTSIDSTNKLKSGNSLKSEFSNYTLNSNGYFASGDFTVTPGNYYKVKFNAVSLKASNIDFNVTQSVSPFATMDLLNANLHVDKDTGTCEYIFKSTSSISNARIIFSTTVYDSTLWVDNVSFLQVSADTSLSTPSINSPVFINNTPITKTITLPGSFIDLDGKATTLTISVPPFSSKIYTKTITVGGATMKTGAFSENTIFTLQNSSLTISPVPTQAGTKIYIQYPVDTQNPDSVRYATADYSIIDMTGKEVSRGTTNFDSLNSIELPTSGLSQGVFIIKLITGAVLKTVKIILN